MAIRYDTDDQAFVIDSDFCEDCGNKTYGEPVELTERLLEFGRQRERQRGNPGGSDDS